MTNMERREALRGMAIALIGGIFWGLAGVFGQFLFEYKGPMPGGLSACVLCWRASCFCPPWL